VIFVEIAYAPGWVARRKSASNDALPGEVCSPRSRKRAVEEEQTPSLGQDARGARDQALCSGPGRDVTILIATTASAWTTGQAAAAASRSSGGNKFGGPLCRARPRCCSTHPGRDRWLHVSSGNAVLNHTACSPVPLAFPTLAPAGEVIAEHTTGIGSRLRAAAGADLAACGIWVATPWVEQALGQVPRARSRVDQPHRGSIKIRVPSKSGPPKTRLETVEIG